MPEDRLIDKDYTYYAKIILKKNSDYPKMYQNAEKLQSDLKKNLDKYENAKGPSKDKIKIQIDTLNIQIANIKKIIAEDDLELDKAFIAYKKAYDQAPNDKSLINDIAVNLYNF